MGEFATTDEVGAKGLAWTKLEETGEVTGGIAKFITEEIKEKLQNKFGYLEYIKTQKNAIYFLMLME